jgi:hypothetical protein
VKRGLFIALTLAVFGCRGERRAEESAPASSAAVSVRPNYNEDIYPIIASSCLPCHAAGGIASRQLDDFAHASAAVPHLPHVVVFGEMPPWGVDTTGTCGSWKDPKLLRGEDASTILAWLDIGAPEGDPARRAVAQLQPPAEPAQGAVHLTIGEGFQPTPGPGVERCFIVDPALERDGFLNGLSLSSQRSVRQVTLFALDTPELEQQAAALDAQDDAPGYPCTGNAHVPGARTLYGLTWNSPLLRLPAGTGLKLAAGRKLVAQVQFEIFALASEKQAELALEIVPNARAGKWTAVRADPLSLEPDRYDVSAEAKLVVSEPLSVLAVYPQMRRLAKGLQLTVDEPGGAGRSCMLKQLDWDYDMLREPRLYTTPQLVRDQSLLTLTCRYNTQGRMAPVTNGDGLDDEECAVLLYSAD